MKHDQAIRSNGKSGSIVHAIKIIMENWKRANVMQGAAAMAYYLLLSLIPLLLVLANVIPLLPLSPDQAISFIETSFPPDVATMLVPVVEDYLASASGGAISIGLLASIWSARSEEHTSELQSRGHLVCRLLLEKKKNTEIRL